MAQRTRTTVAMLLAAALSSAPSLLAAAGAAPPPPGWEDKRRAEGCTVAPAARHIAATMRRIPAAEAGVRSHVAAVAFERAFEVRYEAAFGRAVGVASIPGLGLVLATDRGFWLRLPPPEALDSRRPAIAAVPMVDGGQPVAQSGSIWGSSVIARADGSLVAYDLALCGDGAKALPNGQVSGGAGVTTLGVLNPDMHGFVAGKYILAGGRNGQGWGEADLGLGTAPQPVTLVAAVSPPAGRGRPVALAGWDVAGGCDAVRFMAGGATVRAVSFCSPSFSESTVHAVGDVGFHVTRAERGRAGATLAEFAFPVTAAGGGLVLSAPEAGRLRLTFLALKGAAYREDPRPPRR